MTTNQQTDTSFLPVKSLSTLQEVLRTVISTNGGKPYHAALFLEVNPNTVKRVIGGRYSDALHNAIAKKTGLLDPLPTYKPVEVCPFHGVVHQYDCNKQKTVPRKSRPAIFFAASWMKIESPNPLKKRRPPRKRSKKF